MGNCTSGKKDSKKLDQFNKHRKCHSSCPFIDKYAVDQSQSLQVYQFLQKEYIQF